MTSIVPELDDIVFDQLVEEGRGLIPRYAPEWTDHNLHDPGITLIDLLAWLTEQHVYRIGHVGDSLHAAFTRLMGIAPRGPKPARMLIWPDRPMQVLDFEAGTPLSSPDAIEARYMLSHAVRTVQPAISELIYSKRGDSLALGNGLTEGRGKLELLPAAGGEAQMLELRLSEAITLLAKAGPVSLGVEVTGSGSEAGVANWSPVTIEQWDPGGFWRPLKREDLTKGLRRSGVILFRPDPASPAERLRLRLDRGFRPGPITITRLALNVLPAVEGWRDPGGVIENGDGLPDQRIEIETESIIDRDKTLKIEISRAGETTEWLRRDDLAGSGPGDAHYRLTPDGIVFGNGLNGRVVPEGAQIRVGEVHRTCGASGAVSAGLEWSIAGQHVGLNVAASSPGRDRDRLEDLIARARTASRKRIGALTEAEVSAALMAAGLGLADVQVAPRRRPGLDGKDAPGSRTALILPLRDPATPPEPLQPALRAEAEAVLAPLRLLGERLYVSPPVHVGIDVAVTLIVEPYVDPAELKATSEDILTARLWDLRRRGDVDPWQVGRDVTIGEIEGLMAEQAEVIRVADCRIAYTGRVPGRADIVLGDREIALARNITVDVLLDGSPGADVLPVWLDMNATLIARPGADRDALAAAAEDALRGWSQAGGSVTAEDLGAVLSGLPGLSRVAEAAIAREGGDPDAGPIALKPQERARAGAIDLRVHYPTDRDVP